MSRADQRITGTPLPRWNDRRLVLGRGRYLDDIHLPDTVEVAFVRSPHAHARVLEIHTEAVRNDPRTIAVLTGADMVGRFTPYWSAMGPEARIRRFDLYPLATDKVRWVGEPVALVAAADRYTAEDLVEHVRVDYDALPAVIDPEKALTAESPRLYESWPDNVVSHQVFNPDPDGFRDMFSRAHRVIRRRFRSNRHTAVPLETRGIIAHYDRYSEVLTVYIGHQDVHLVRITLAKHLGLPMANIRVVSPDVGGAFGIKLPIYPEELAVCFLALQLDRPVKWVQDRREGLLGDTHAREAIVDAELALDDEARILALRADIISDAGAYGVAGRGPTIEGGMIAREMVGPYRIVHYHYDLKVVMTNKAPVAVYRGVGIPVTTLVLERLMDEAAKVYDLDPAEIRRRNLIQEFPWTTPVGHVYDTGSYVEALEKALEAFDYDAARREQEQARRENRLVGIGICVYNDASARGGAFYGKLGMPVSGQEGCSLSMDPTGRVTAAIGTAELGQGLKTAFAQIVADEVGVPVDHVTVVMGDTERTLYGGGSWASRSAVSGGSAVLLASRKLASKLRQIAGYLLEVAPEDIELVSGEARVRGVPGLSVPYTELAKRAYFIASELPPGMEPGLEVSSHWEPEIPATFSNGAHIAMVEVDRATGAIKVKKWVAVHDCGTVINPGLVEGQLIGGMAQGIGGAVLEHMIYDANGQLLTDNLINYLLPSLHDLPEVEVHHLVTPSVRNPLGAKGMAESGTVAAPATLANAVADALSVDVDELPLSPNRIFELLQQKAGAR